jgi:hypothetical protein
MIEKLCELGDEIKVANSEIELDKIEGAIDSILKAELAGTGESNGSNMAALGLAALRLHYLMGLRRSQIQVMDRP